MNRAISWISIAVVITGSSCAILMGAGFWASKETSRRLDIGYRESTSSKPVQLEIGDRVFAIPNNHIWSRESWKGGKVSSVNLHALLPDFEAYTQANQHEFDKPGWNRKVTLLLIEHNVPESRTGSASMTRRAVYNRMLYDDASQKERIDHEAQAPFGLTLHALSPPIPSGKELYSGFKKDGGFYWVRCGREEKYPYPSCTTYIEFSEKTSIKYRFSRKLLSDWESIDNSVLNFVRQFVVTPKQG
ncbi:MAG: hypothetical protein HUJ18_00045 [Marinobacter sp.]|nr:hypothetical protein [Marinobacter sp.]